MTKILKGARIKMEEFRTDVRNLGQHFFDISKKIISVINKWQLLKITLKFLFWHQKRKEMELSSQKLGYIQ
jgi:hypothetical protein